MTIHSHPENMQLPMTLVRPYSSNILSIKMVQEPPQKNSNLRYSPQITLHKVNMGTRKGFEGYLLSFYYKRNFTILFYRIKTEGIADMDIFVNKWLYTKMKFIFK